MLPLPLKRAFSLVELSIVLVILGLLVGSVLAGQSLIRAAELRSVATEYNKYVTASRTFRDRYFGLPGVLIWKQLANAGLIEGTYSGTTATNGGYSGLTTNMSTIQPGWNTPKSKLPSATWDAQKLGALECIDTKILRLPLNRC